ncbi:LamG-like jellyroll fold domain-containing protein [Kordia sp.]|uniref:LamG-like jellyroll fold domain-containing protein n=1 Tax=Kordia sp. TaxID=1965332 RepID=UPI003D6A1B4A
MLPKPTLFFILFLFLSSITIQAQCIIDQTVIASPTTDACSADVVVSLGSSQTGVNYFLRDDADNSSIEGPIVGTGNQINFTSETITADKTYNVYATKTSGALDFNGTTAYINCGANVSLEVSGALTMQAWIYPTAFKAYDIIINKEGEYEMGLRNGELAIAIDNTSPNWNWIDSGATVPLNEWTHVAATYDNATSLIILYINGVAVFSTAGTGLITDALASQNELWIGDRSGAGSSNFTGKIDEVSVWNTAQTGIEILNQMNSCFLTGSETGLIAAYGFEEGTGSIVTDLSPNGNNGTLINTSWTTYETSEVMTNTPTVTITNDTENPTITCPSDIVVATSTIINPTSIVSTFSVPPAPGQTGGGIDEALVNMINGSGLSSFPSLTATHQSGSSSSRTWTGSGTSGVLTFNLGGLQPVNSLSFWNISGSSSTLGVNQVEILASTDGVNFALIPDTPTNFAEASTILTPQIFNFPTTNATHIKFNIISNHGYTGSGGPGSGPAVGIAEVAFGFQETLCSTNNVNLGTPVTSDDCGVASVTNNAPTVFPVGDTTVIWTVTDTVGNTATCSQLVTVNDTVNPTITCPLDIVTACSPSDLGTPVTSDNCGIASITNDAPATFPVGDTTVTWTVTDNAGNTAMCSQLVTINIDTENPTITCPSDIVTTTLNTTIINPISAATTFTTFQGPNGEPISEQILNMINGSGLSSFPSLTAGHQILDGPEGSSIWAGQGTSGEITFNLGGLQSVNSLSFWNYGGATGGANGAGVNGVEILASTDGINFTLIPDTPTNFSQVTTTFTPEIFNFPTISATHIKFNVLSNHSTLSFVAIGEVAFGFSEILCTANNTDLGTPVTSDNCGIASVTNDAPAILPIGDTTVIWTVTDNAGNTAMCSQLVTVTAPEINVLGNAVTITNGDIIPDAADDTAYGDVYIGDYLERTFTIENTGDEDLILSGTPLISISGSTDFTVTAAPVSPVTLGGGTTTFTVRYTPSAVVTNDTATISITSNDCDEAIYDFTVQGTAIEPIILNAKVYLQGTFMNPDVDDTSLMRDDLRDANYIPTTSPYADGLICNATVFNTGGTDGTGPISDDIVDWVWVELRDATDNTVITEAKSALLQRDGNIVAVDGVSDVPFSQPNNNFYVVVKHRNHLGIMSANTIALSKTPISVDFTNSTTPITFGTNAQATIIGSPNIVALWAGNVNNDQLVQYSGTSPDTPSILSSVLNDSGNFLNFPTYQVLGYNMNDIDMNGSSQYSGIEPDTPYILQNVLAHPGNSLNFSTHPIQEQLPEN